MKIVYRGYDKTIVVVISETYDKYVLSLICVGQLKIRLNIYIDFNEYDAFWE